MARGLRGKTGFWAGPKVERGRHGTLPPVTLTTAAGTGRECVYVCVGNLARSGAPPLARAVRYRESCAGEEARARPEVGGDGQDGVGGRAGQEVGPVYGRLCRQAG